MRPALRPWFAASFVCLTTACPTGATDDAVGTFSTGNTDVSDTETGDDAPECGNGTIEADEQCDDGPANAAEGQCTPECTLAACGDGYPATTEECDDANADNTDGCVDGCKLATCGDGFVQTDVEACDDGNDVETDSCSSLCVLAICGDGVTQDGEACDDGNRDTTDECTTCQLAICGDGFVQTDVEVCDDGNDVETDACTTTCVDAVCGDGIVWEGMEECDDANDADDDACTTTCANAICGDGIVWADMEECDDANNVDGDGCNAICELECDDLVLVEDWNGWTYYKVPVEGTLSNANVIAACTGCGLQVPCTGPQGCVYNDASCVQTNNEDSCNPMQDLAQLMCSSAPNLCQLLWGVYQSMGNLWNAGAACGAEQSGWCSNGNNTSNKYALCVSQ